MSIVSVIKNFTIIACRNITSIRGVSVKKAVGNKPFSGMHYLCMGLLAIVTSCNNTGKSDYIETPTRGDIRISVDEFFNRLLKLKFILLHLYILMQR